MLIRFPDVIKIDYKYTSTVEFVSNIMYRLLLCSCLILHMAFGFHVPITTFSSSLIGGIDTRKHVNGVIKTSLQSSRNRRQFYSTATNSDHAQIQPSSSSSSVSGKFDSTAVMKYIVAIAVQMGLFTLLFRSMDMIVTYFKIQKVPFVINCILFYGLALKSRIFNPMSNTRPQVKTLEADVVADTTTTTTTTTDETKKTKDVATIFRRKMPSWTPPGIVFPIVWLLIIGPIRAISTSMIYQTVGSYASIPILSLLLHLSIGDVWNTINNVERRFGVAVTGVLCVWLSKAHAAYQYSRVNHVAGTLLGATLIWLTIASALVTATWQLNPDPVTGKPEPLYPVVGNGITKFAWFSQKA
jgi:translocator protein